MDPNNRLPYSGVPYQQPTESDPLLEFAKRWWWLLAIGVLIGGVAAVAYSSYGSSTYVTTALVQIQPQAGNDPTAKAGQARSATSNYAAEASSSRIIGLVADRLSAEPGITKSQLSSMVRSKDILIRPMRNANFIEFTVTDTDPDRAQMLADTFAEVFVEDINGRDGVQYEGRYRQLEEQIAFTRQELARSELFQRETTLQNEIRDQRGLLLSLQSSYQQELYEAEEASQPAQVATLRANNLEILGEQILEVEGELESLNGQLDEVRAALDGLPAGTDRVTSSAYASAYSLELSALTRQYVAEQLNALTANPPLVRYGEASIPYADSSVKRLAMLGVAAGGLAAAGIGFLLDILRRRRSQSPSGPDALRGGQDEFDRLKRLLDELQGARPSAVPVAQSSLTTHVQR